MNGNADKANRVPIDDCYLILCLSRVFVLYLLEWYVTTNRELDSVVRQSHRM